MHTVGLHYIIVSSLSEDLSWEALTKIVFQSYMVFFPTLAAQLLEMHHLGLLRQKWVNSIITKDCSNHAIYVHTVHTVRHPGPGNSVKALHSHWGYKSNHICLVVVT